MIRTCLLHNLKKCSRKKEIRKFRSKENTALIVCGFDWGTRTDNPALVYDLYEDRLKPKAQELGLDLRFQKLGGRRSGSIYCDICCQIQKADIAILDLSTNNMNVIFELGLAIGSGAYVYIFRSRHQQHLQEQVSDLRGIMEYRFTRKSGRLHFQVPLTKNIIHKLKVISRRKREDTRS